MGRVGQLPQQWEEGLVCPIYKKCPQEDPASYRSVCLLSHTRKVVDMAILYTVNETFEPAECQFVFRGGISVMQALLQADYNATQGIEHKAVLDLEKAYDKVDRHTLLEVAKEWLEGDLWKVVSSMLGPMRLTTKGDPTNFAARMTKGTQGPPRHRSFSTCILTNWRGERRKYATRGEAIAQR